MEFKIILLMVVAASLYNTSTVSGKLNTEETLNVLKELTPRYLTNCDISFFYDDPEQLEIVSNFIREIKVIIPNYATTFKIYNVSGEVLSHGDTWTKRFCNMNIFLVNDGRSLLNHTSVHYNERLMRGDSKHFWNFDAKVLLFTKSKDLIDQLKDSYILKRSRDLIYFQMDDNGMVRMYTPYPHMKKLVYLGNFRSFIAENKELFPDKFHDFSGVELILSTFVHPPSVYFVRNDEEEIIESLGTDLKVIESLAETLNFKIRYNHVDRKFLWEKQLDNGTWKGLIGDLINGDSDFGVANIFIEERRAGLITYSTPYAYTQACFIAPGPKPLPRWSSLIRPFSTYTWATLAGFVLVSTMFLYFVSQKSVRKEPVSYMSWSFDLLYIVGLLAMRSPIVRPRQNPLKVYLGFLWIFAILVTTMYSANLISFLSIVPKSAPIKTISQMNKKGLPVSAHYFFKLQLKKSLDNDIMNLIDRVEINGDLSEALAKVAIGEGTAVENKGFLDLYVSLFSTGGDSSALRIVDECINPYAVGVGLQKFSPYKKEFDEVILRTIEAGFDTYWRQDLIRKYKASHKKEGVKQLDDTESGQQPLTIDHLQGVFLAYFLGMILSLIIFGLENLIFKIGKKKE